jgi:hypothetical protein
MSSDAILALYIIGALLELGGVALVGWDVLDSRRKLRDMSEPDWGHRQAAEGQQVRSLFELMAEVTAGNICRRAIGVTLFTLGVFVQTAANITSLERARSSPGHHVVTPCGTTRGHQCTGTPQSRIPTGP